MASDRPSFPLLHESNRTIIILALSTLRAQARRRGEQTSEWVSGEATKKKGRTRASHEHAHSNTPTNGTKAHLATAAANHARLETFAVLQQAHRLLAATAERVLGDT